MKKFQYFVVLSVMLSTFTLSANAINLSANSAILVELESGRVLYEKNPDHQQLIASITKLMTALVAVESGVDLEESVTVGEESCYIEGSSLYLKPNEVISFEGLLYGMLLRSGNDAATAIAHHCAPSLEQFVDQMNQKAFDLGMENTSFQNPHGLDGETHYSTAQDMATLARACLQNEIIREAVATKEISVGGRILVNHNKLLWQYEGAIGLKTGYTQAAGRTLISAATRDGMTLIVVTLDASDDWSDHTKLLDHGFETYQMTTLAKQGDPLVHLPISHSLLPFASLESETTLRYPLKEGESLTLAMDSQPITAPILRGEPSPVRATWSLDGTEQIATTLVYSESISSDLAPNRNFWQKIWLN